MTFSLSFSLGTLCSVICKEVNNTVKSTASDTASYLYTKAKEKYPDTVEKIEKVAKSDIGKAVLSGAPAFIGEWIGMGIGGAFPLQMAALSAGRRGADCIVSDSKNPEVTESKELITWSAGVGAALTVTALSATMTYLIGDPSSGNVACEFLLTSLGKVVGGLEGLRLVGAEPEMPKDIYDSYQFRTVQYLGAQGIVQAVRTVIPVPQSLEWLTGLVGNGLVTAAGTGGFHARFLVQQYNRPVTENKVNYFDPGEALKAALEYPFGSKHYFNYETAKSVESNLNSLIDQKKAGTQPLVSNLMTLSANLIPLAAKFIEGKLDQVIDQKVGTNVLVRAFNEYAYLIKHSDIQQAISELSSCEDLEQRKVLQQKLRAHIHGKMVEQFGLTEKMMDYALQTNADPMVSKHVVDPLVKQINDIEIQKTGFRLSDPQKNKALLEVHATNYLTLALIQMKRALPNGVDCENLKDHELKNFYQNLNSMIFTPYTGTTMGWFAQRVASMAIPLALDHGQGLAAHVLIPRQNQIEEIPEEFFVNLNKNEGTLREESVEENFPMPLPTTTSPLLMKFPFLLNVKNFFTSAWDSMISIFKGKRNDVIEIDIPSPKVSYLNVSETKNEQA